MNPAEHISKLNLMGLVMNIVKTVLTASAVALATCATPAMANWKVVETEHFRYYSEADEEELLDTVKRLETFDALVRALTSNTRPSNPVKVTMFEVASMADVNATFPYPSRGVGGYYSSTIEGPFLVTFRDNLRTGRNSARRAAKRSIAWGPEVRQHEYLHHYMYQYFNANYPSWYSEGFAEYYGTMYFPEDGVVEIGHAPHFRMDAIRGGSWVDVGELLTAKSYADIKDTSALYAQGWLLTHMAAQKPERGEQLQKYLAAVSTGTDYETAATQAFGDLDALNKELRDHRKNIQAMRLSLKPMDFGDIEVRELSDLESRLMRYEIRKNSGFEVSDLPLTLTAIREMREEDPNNIMGLRIQAELEVMAGEYDNALATTEKLLAIDPGNIQALTERGRAMVGKLGSDASADDWAKARESLQDAVAASSAAVEPRVALFRSYLDQGVQPSLEAQNRLVEAFTLLPQNDEIRYLLARDFEQRGYVEDAIAVIKPAAFGAFDGDEKEKKKRKRYLEKYAEQYTNINSYEDAADMLKRLEAKRDGKWDEASQSIIDDTATDS